MNASRPVFNLLSKQVRSYATKPNFPPPHMNELPVPCGSWQAAYDANQRKYNTILATGIVFCIGSIIIAKESGLLYFNMYAPKTID